MENTQKIHTKKWKINQFISLKESYKFLLSWEEESSVCWSLRVTLDMFFLFLTRLQPSYCLCYDVWFDLQGRWPAILGQFPYEMISDQLQMAGVLCQWCWVFEIVLSSRWLFSYCGRKNPIYSVSSENRNVSSIRIVLSTWRNCKFTYLWTFQYTKVFLRHSWRVIILHKHYC